VDLQSGFDQYAAAVLVARSAVFKRDTDEPLDVIRWLDRSLIRLMSRFANYRQEDVNSFRLSAEFFVFPQLMYHLRRSNLLQSHNSSLDESSFHRVCFKRENVVNCLLMIRPALMEYSFNSNVPRPVSLDVSSLKPTIVLLLDAFFHIVVWRGETVQQWYENEYHLNPEYAHFKQLITSPEEDVEKYCRDRFPAPKFIPTWEGESQARFLLSVVNPSRTQNSKSFHGGGTEEAAILTDDVSHDVFMKHLIGFAVD
jgi:protein transport protein SEC23